MNVYLNEYHHVQSHYQKDGPEYPF